MLCFLIANLEKLLNLKIEQRKTEYSNKNKSKDISTH
jgi:hypothetical protein